jgi:hypothetical protein
MKSFGMRSISCLTAGPFFRYYGIDRGLKFPSEAFQKRLKKDKIMNNLEAYPVSPLG